MTLWSCFRRMFRLQEPGMAIMWSLSNINGPSTLPYQISRACSLYSTIVFEPACRAQDLQSAKTTCHFRPIGSSDLQLRKYHSTLTKLLPCLQINCLVDSWLQLRRFPHCFFIVNACAATSYTRKFHNLHNALVSDSMLFSEPDDEDSNSIANTIEDL